MEDKQIVDLYWERSEAAIAETEKKYGRYCHYIAYQILYNDEDAKEVVIRSDGVGRKGYTDALTIGHP